MNSSIPGYRPVVQIERQGMLVFFNGGIMLPQDASRFNRNFSALSPWPHDDRKEPAAPPSLGRSAGG